jgi:hypothetical protein
MAGKAAVKKQSGPPQAVRETDRVCSVCEKGLMSNAIYTYKEIVFTVASKNSRMRYTCKEHAKRAGDSSTKK